MRRFFGGSVSEQVLGVQELTRSRCKWGFGEGLLKDKFAFFETYKNPTPKRRKLLAKRPFLKLDRVSFSTPESWEEKTWLLNQEFSCKISSVLGVGRTPKGSPSPRGRSEAEHLLESPF